MLMCSSDVPGGASTISTSIASSPQNVSFRKDFMMLFLRGPRQMIASSGCASRKPMDITARLSSTYTGDHPRALWCTSCPSRPSILGMPAGAARTSAVSAVHHAAA